MTRSNCYIHTGHVKTHAEGLPTLIQPVPPIINPVLQLDPQTAHLGLVDTEGIWCIISGVTEDN